MLFLHNKIHCVRRLVSCFGLCPHYNTSLYTCPLLLRELSHWFCSKDVNHKLRLGSFSCTICLLFWILPPLSQRRGNLKVLVQHYLMKKAQYLWPHGIIISCSIKWTTKFRDFPCCFVYGYDVPGNIGNYQC